jgi:hypothetical protein
MTTIEPAVGRWQHLSPPRFSEVSMLTVGNRKLGRQLIWSFSLPSGLTAACPGASPVCLAHCYARAFERYRPTAVARYRRNFALSRRRDFTRRVRAFLVAHAVRVVRVHVGGDFYSEEYARKWLRVISRSPRVKFYFYTRSWQISAIRAVIDQMATLPNCRAWYSCDADTCVPADVPPGVRVAWLQTDPDDLPPSPVHLVFRVRSLRSSPAPCCGPLVCPAEVGMPSRVTCERCGHCWRHEPASRVSLPVVLNPAEDHDPT